LIRELKRKLDLLWANRKGLGVDFNSPGALKIELVQDSSRITQIVKEIGEGMLDIKIDQRSGLIKVYYGGRLYLKWEAPKGEK
jgi:L-rhamnose isomerase